MNLALADGPATSLVAFIEGRQNFYNFMGGTSTQHSARNKDELLRILASFREVKP